MLNPKDIITASSPTSNISPGAAKSLPVNLPFNHAITVPSGPPELLRPLYLTILLTLLSLDLIYRTAMSVINILLTIRSFQSGNSLAHLYETSPLLCFSPFIFALITTLAIFLIYKTSLISAQNYLLLKFFALVIPASYFAVTYAVSPRPVMASLLFTETNIISILIFLSVLFTPKVISRSKTPLTDNQTISFALFASILLFPTFFFSQALVNSSVNPDLNRAKIEIHSGHKLYAPSTLPKDLRPDTRYYVDNKKYPDLPHSVIKIVYTTPAKSLFGRLDVILSQTKVNPDFDLEKFVNGNLGQTKPEKQILDIALNKLAFSKTTTDDNNLNLKSVYFITSDSILITLTSPSPSITSQDLVSIATSLR